MARSVCHVASASDDGKRLDVVLAENGIYKSRSNAQKMIEGGQVLCNTLLANKKQAVCTGDVIICNVEDGSNPKALMGEPIDLDIRFEDDDLIVLSKQAGLICHPTDDCRAGTLVNALIYRYGAQNLCNVQGEDDRLGIVHRLDADTSGLMLAAKTDIAGQMLMDDIRLRNVDRRYLALVHGVIQPDTGMIDAPIGRNPSDRKAMAVSDADSARDAITTFSVIERFEPAPDDMGYTLVECKLYTGRTHQIRVHMQYIRHPIVGDPVYTSHSPKSPRSALGLERQFLHSYKIGFDHPITLERIEFTDTLPDDLSEALDSIQGRSLGRTGFGKEIGV